MTAPFSLAHPSRKRLLAWLNDEASPKLTHHVEQCERCAETLEEIATGPDVDDRPMADELGTAIREAFIPPPDLSERVLQRISERERTEQEMSLLLGMMSITKDMAELMMTDGGSDASAVTGTDNDVPEHETEETTS